MSTERVEHESSDQKEITTNSFGKIYFSVQWNPLLIDTVLYSLFRIVDYDTLKECRIVCQQWKTISDGILIERSAFKIPESCLESSTDIPTLFTSISQEDNPVRFSAYKFQLLQLTLLVKEIYLEPYKTTMTQLEITNARTTMARISGFQNADNFLGPNLIKLKLFSEYDYWKVSIEKIMSIEHLDLSQCKILVNPGIKIAPIELKLDHCQFSIKNQDLNDNESPITDFVDCHRLEKLDLFNLKVECNNGTRSLILDLSDCIKVKSLCLAATHINLDAEISPEELTLMANIYRVNGHNVSTVVLSEFLSSGARIRKLKIGDSKEKFEFEKALSIEEIDVDGFVNFRESVVTNIKKVRLPLRKPSFESVSVPIPKSVEYLELTSDSDENEDSQKYPILRELFIFPKLKGLILHRGCASRLKDFQHCPELVHITIYYSNYEMPGAFDVDCLPPSITSLSFKGTRYHDAQIVGTKELELELLVLGSYLQPKSVEMSDLDTVISFFKQLWARMPKVHLVIFHRLTDEYPFDERDISNIMSLKQEMGLGSIAFGPVSWESEELFQNSFLFPLVDRKSECYLFEGNNVKAISIFEFCKLLPTF